MIENRPVIRISLSELTKTHCIRQANRKAIRSKFIHIKWAICLILVFLAEISFAQKNYEFMGQINDLNFYKYLQVRAAIEDDAAFLNVTSLPFTNKAITKSDLMDSVQRKFKSCGLAILPNYSTLELERKGYNKEEILHCLVYMENNSKTTKTEIVFLNETKEVIYYVRNGNGWSLYSTVKKVLNAFDKYTYHYDDYFSKKAITANNNVIVGNIKKETDSTKSNTKVVHEKAPVSDVDLNIPIGTQNHPYRFALVIGNEDYKSFQSNLNFEANVEYAENDAVSFKEYAIKTLGVPKENVIFILNAGQVKMKTALTKMKLLAKNSAGKAQLIFYYAGHGLPDDNTKEPYLIPVDVSGSNLSYALKLKDVYKELSEYPSQRITVFLDACFSGGARDQALLAVRGVRVKPREEAITGKMVVFSASTDDQSASAYTEKMHGMFTYYLLKKLQETNGNVTYNELGAYVNEKVSLKSVLVNEKEQNPQISVNPEIKGQWESWTIN